MLSTVLLCYIATSDYKTKPEQTYNEPTNLNKTFYKSESNSKKPFFYLWIRITTLNFTDRIVSGMIWNVH